MKEILKKIGKAVYSCKIVQEDDSILKDKIYSFVGCKGKSYRPNRSRWENNNPIRVLSSEDEYSHFMAYNFLHTPKEVETVKEGYFDGGKRHLAPKILKIKSYIVKKNPTNDGLLFKVSLIPANPKEDFDLKKENLVASFKSLMLNQDVEDLLQLQRFDVTGHEHDNVTKDKDFIATSDEEYELYKKYFGNKAGFPHFHFFNVNGLDKFAISNKNLQSYILDLATCRDDNLLNTYSLGMPFLYMKKNTYCGDGFAKSLKNYIIGRDALYFQEYRKLRKVVNETNTPADTRIMMDYEDFLMHELKKDKNLLSIINEWDDMDDDELPYKLLICYDTLNIINFYDDKVRNNHLYKELSDVLFKHLLISETNLANNLTEQKSHSKELDDKNK